MAGAPSPPKLTVALALFFAVILSVAGLVVARVWWSAVAGFGAGVAIGLIAYFIVLLLNRRGLVRPDWRRNGKSA